LEQRVAERTADLTSINEQLQQEIAERRQAEEELRLQSRIAANMAEGVQLIRAGDGVIVYANPRFEEIFGYGQNELIGKHVSVLNAPAGESPKEVAAEIANSLIESGEWHGEIHNIKKDGTLFWCRAGVSTLEHSRHGKIWISVHQDITERKEMQERLVRSEKLAVMGQLAGSVGHELRNPLGVLSNAAYFLKMTLSDANETTKEYLEIVASQVRKAEKIVSDLLNFARTRPAEREKTAVSDLVGRVLADHPPPERVEVSTRLAADLPPVVVDPQQIEQVLVNLVTNAYQAMPEGGRLSVAGEQSLIPNLQSPASVSISVTDTGGGILPENKARLFEPLFTTRARGIGLGLAVSKNLVEINGGSIEVESEKDKGSTFTIILPAGEMEG
jgi:PAS domain S-box-containing protein